MGSDAAGANTDLNLAQTGAVKGEWDVSIDSSEKLRCRISERPPL